MATTINHWRNAKMENAMNTQRVNHILSNLLRDHPETSAYVADLLQEMSGTDETVVAAPQIAAATQDIQRALAGLSPHTLAARGRHVALNKAKYELRPVGSNDHILLEIYGKRLGQKVTHRQYIKVAKAIETIAKENDGLVPLEKLGKVALKLMHVNSLRMMVRFWKINRLIELSYEPYRPASNFTEQAQKLWDSLRYGPEGEVPSVQTPTAPTA